MAEDSTFSVIFGYDFLRKFRVNIDSNYKCCTIDGISVPFINEQSRDTSICNNLLSLSEYNSTNSLPIKELLIYLTHPVLVKMKIAHIILYLRN